MLAQVQGKMANLYTMLHLLPALILGSRPNTVIVLVYTAYRNNSGVPYFSLRIAQSVQ